MERSYRVDGMSCEGCVRAVTKAITKQAPGSSVAVDLAAGRVTVAGEAPPQAVADAVSTAGFTFLGAVE